MTPTCPTCGSVAIERSGKVAACMNPRCRDNGTLKRIQTFQPDFVSVPHDPRRVWLISGGCHIRPVYYEDAA